MQSKISKIRLDTAMRWIVLGLALACTGAGAQPAVDIETLEAAAQRGDVQAMVMLASRYERGENIQRDYIKANELYCKAAARGDGEALLKLGIIYSIGRGVPADEGIAALLVGKAAELGNESAKRLLQFAGRPADSVLPACLSEMIVPRVPASVLAARKDIELLVRQWAPQYAIDPDLVMALIAVESGFNVTAVSPKNAQGLMQLIPGTAERFGVKNVYNPLQNLKGGLAYLRWLMAYFEGDVALVLAAYNSGEETVERYRGIPPYAETRNYVKQITGIYRKPSHPYVTEVVAPSPALNRIKRAN
jgi:soluble lytic murein transglycosylase-like protein